jgi:hypothetical protein
MIVHGRVDPSPLVEDPHDRQLLDPRLALHADHVVAPCDQPIRRPAAQLVEVIGDVEHAPIKPWGYDTYRLKRRVSGWWSSDTSGPPGWRTRR